MIANDIIEEWKRIGLPTYKEFGNLSEEEKKEILEISKDEEKLKNFWESLSLEFKLDDKEETKNKFSMDL